MTVPWQAQSSGRHPDRQIVLFLNFAEHIEYNYKFCRNVNKYLNETNHQLLSRWQKRISFSYRLQKGKNLFQLLDYTFIFLLLSDVINQAGKENGEYIKGF